MESDLVWLARSSAFLWLWVMDGRTYRTTGLIDAIIWIGGALLSPSSNNDSISMQFSHIFPPILLDTLSSSS